MAKSVCFYFQIHQPYRLRFQSLLEPPADDNYFTGISPFTNHEVFEKVARKSYLPMLGQLRTMLHEYPEFTFSLSVTGVFVEQCMEFGDLGQQVIAILQDLADTGRVEFLAETYSHSLCFLYSKLEWAYQIQKHRDLMLDVFGVKPKVFRNTELIVRNDLIAFIRAMGFHGMVAEGWDPNISHDQTHIHSPAVTGLNKDDHRIAKKHHINTWWKKPKKRFGILTKHYKLSDDMAFRFGNKGWEHHPLMSGTYTDWIDQAPGDTVNLFMDFETFGEHQWEDTGIFDFVWHLPQECKKRGIEFRTPSQTLKAFNAVGYYDAPKYVSWADEARDISAWVENDMQRSALFMLMEVEDLLHPYRNSKKPIIKELWDDFRKLQTSDHLYYMCTKYWADGDVHAYFSPYNSPYDAYINYMNVMTDLKKRCQRALR